MRKGGKLFINSIGQNLFWISSRFGRVKFIGFCYVVFNSQMFNATEVQLWKWCFHIKLLLFMRPIHVWRSRTLPNACYHNNNGAESKVVKTIELSWAVYRVAEPFIGLFYPQIRHQTGFLKSQFDPVYQFCNGAHPTLYMVYHFIFHPGNCKNSIYSKWGWRIPFSSTHIYGSGGNESRGIWC
jgi:hypothetical protein